MNRLRAMTIGGALLVAFVLAIFAYVIADSQRGDRRDAEQRFRDVADVAAAVTNGIFRVSLNTARQQGARRLSERVVDRATLDALAAQEGLAYIDLRDARGRRVAASTRAPVAARTGATAKLALEAGQGRFSQVLSIRDTQVIEAAAPFRTPHGIRVYVRGTRATLFAVFLRGFLGEIPNFAQAESLVIDNQGIVIGGTNLSTPAGEMLEDAALLESALSSDSGSYGDGRYFASAPIASSPFRVVLDADKDAIYASVSGSRAIPWILFAAFALAALVGLLLLRRAARLAAELSRRELNERHAVEINDNIIQGLALAKYQLQLGQEEASAEQLAQTLGEAQRLVSGLLGSAAVQAGQLRREVAADTGPEFDTGSRPGPQSDTVLKSEPGGEPEPGREDVPK